MVHEKELHEKPYFFLPKGLKRCYSQEIALENDFSCIIRKDNISQIKTWTWDIFCIFDKEGISFPYKCNITFLSRKYMSNDLLPKNTVKDDISGIIEKDDIHARKYGISSARKRKVIKMFTQSNTHRENYCD